MRYCLCFVLLCASARADFQFIELIATAPSGQQSAEVLLERWFEVTEPTLVGLYGSAAPARPEYCIDSPDIRSNCYWTTLSSYSLQDSAGNAIFRGWYNREMASWFEPQPSDSGGFGGGFRTLEAGLYRMAAHTSYTLFPPIHDAVVGPMVGGYAKYGMRVDSAHISNLNLAVTPEPSALVLTLTIFGIVGFLARKRLRSI